MNRDGSVSRFILLQRAQTGHWMNESQLPAVFGLLLRGRGTTKEPTEHAGLGELLQQSSPQLARPSCALAKPGREQKQEPLRRLKSEVERGNGMMRHFFETGEQNDLELLVSWMRNQFLQPILYGLEEETSRSRLENWFAHLQKGSTRFREVPLGATTPNKRKFAERWSSEMDAAISLIQERLRKLEDSTPSSANP
jgi:hypothetical protein